MHDVETVPGQVCLMPQPMMVKYSLWAVQLQYFNTPMQLTLEFNNFKNDNFLLKNCDTFLIFAQNIDCGYTIKLFYRGGSKEYPQSMF